MLPRVCEYSIHRDKSKGSGRGCDWPGSTSKRARKRTEGKQPRERYTPKYKTFKTKNRDFQRDFDLTGSLEHGALDCRPTQLQFLLATGI